MFTEPDTWSGGYFELAIENGSRDDERLREAVAALWKHPSLVGCYLDVNREPQHQRQLAAELQPIETKLYGVATTPIGHEVACISIPLRFEAGIDWLYFSIPLGSLARVYRIGTYPFDDETSRDWILSVSEWFAKIGKSVFASTPFQLGVIGWEADDFLDVPKVKQDGVPDERWVGYLWPRNGELHWYAPNILRPPITLERKSRKN